MLCMPRLHRNPHSQTSPSYPRDPRPSRMVDLIRTIPGSNSAAQPLPYIHSSILLLISAIWEWWVFEGFWKKKFERLRWERETRGLGGRGREKSSSGQILQSNNYEAIWSMLNLNTILYYMFYSSYFFGFEVLKTRLS